MASFCLFQTCVLSCTSRATRIRLKSDRQFFPVSNRHWFEDAVTVSGDVNRCYFSTDTGVEGSGDEGGGGGGTQTVSLDVFRECTDRVMMPCDFEEFITVCWAPLTRSH